MFLHKKFTAASCACALAIGLAACSGGGGGSSGPTAEEQRAAIDQLVEAAKTAVRTLEAASDAGAVAPAAIAAAIAAVAAAKEALTDANRLSPVERSALDTAISVIEGRLADELREATSREAERLSAAIAGPRITGIRAAVAHGAAPSMSATLPGPPLASVAGLKTAASSAVRKDGEWQGGTYGAAEDGVVDTVVLYTNIATPGTRPFAGEDGKYSTNNELDADGNLPIVSDTDTTLAASDAFPSGPGIVSHETEADGTVRVAGSFDGAAGGYVCTPETGGACTSSVRHGGGYTLAGGSWKFVPVAGAEVPDPDTEYQYFGWWLRQTGDTSAIGVFHAGVGGAPDEFRELLALQGTATYRGRATGKYTLEPRGAAVSAGDFVATVTLQVDFGDIRSPGTVDGTVDGFRVNGEMDANTWSVTLGSALINPRGAIAGRGDHAARTVWSIGGNAGTNPDRNPPTWSGQLHDVGARSVPTVATGVFEASYDEVGRMIGAFGTTRQP